MMRVFRPAAFAVVLCSLFGSAYSQSETPPRTIRSSSTAWRASAHDASARQIQSFLSANPGLRTGISLPDGTTVRAHGAIPGGVRYVVGGLPRGQLIAVDVTGPPSVLSKAFLDALWADIDKGALAMVEVLEEVRTHGGPATAQQRNCIGVAINGSTRSVSMTSDPRAGCDSVEQ